LQRAASMLAPSLLRHGVDGRDEMLWGWRPRNWLS
jgi:hypothetical protein